MDRNLSTFILQCASVAPRPLRRVACKHPVFLSFLFDIRSLVFQPPAKVTLLQRAWRWMVSPSWVVLC